MGRKTVRDSLAGGVLLGKNETATERVLVVELVARIEFGAVRENVAIYPRGHAVENEVADIVRPEKDRTVTIEDRRLEVEIAGVLLISQNFVGVILRLVFVELGRIEIRSSHVIEYRRLPRIVRDLKIIVIVSGQEREPAGVVDDVR